ncbi:TRAP transporter substrate-binding protein [Parasulfitobacter algicola]|uniref:TRAP transporter substrate-binding protein n=1 Tax=Parasulfitobacter algicola TaxID=2614809 RepID=A0ABX2IX85_9RHOB|nr:TRAP transporter substrate-binding protein [Sulfitobacter algicola]NSX54773.1 TRAP transporter substrate-binding protein [Sulfitobacter algicola]
MNRFLRSALAGAFIAGLGAGVVMAQEVTLRCQHFLSPKASIPAGFITPWAEKIEAESGGRIKVEIYPSMQLGGKPPELYDQMRDGVIDCGWALPAYNPGRFPEAEVFELPFMTSMSAEGSSKALWEFYDKYMQERFGDIKVMAIHLHGPGIIHTKGDPVTSLTDFQGLKLRGPSRQANALLEAVGATTVGIPVPAFPEALSKGIVDGGVIPWEVVPPLKVHELANSHTQISGDRALYNTVFVWGMNKAKYDSLPDDLKAVIDANSGLETSAWAGRAMDEGDTVGEKVVADRGNRIHTLSDDIVTELKVIGDDLTAKWIAEASSKGLDAQTMVDDARAMVAKHSDGM